MNSKIRKNIHIEILKYAHKHNEFLCNNLLDDLNFNQNEKGLFFGKLINEKSLLQNLGRTQKTDNGEENLYTISTEGRFKLLEFEQLDNANKSSSRAIKIAIYLLVVAIVGLSINFFSLKQTQQSLELSESSLKQTQQSLELSAIPEVSISIKEYSGLNKNKLPFLGHSQISSSTANFVLKNNFLGGLKDIDINMIMLEKRIDIDEESQLLSICPFAYVSYENNPDFKFEENRLTTSILDNKLYNLKSLEEIPFSIDFNDLNSIMSNIRENTSNTDFFIKVDINYKKEIDGKPFSISKIYKIVNYKIVSGGDKDVEEEYLVDTDINKDTILIGGEFPSIIKPFRENSFVETLKTSFIQPYSVEQSECEFF